MRKKRLALIGTGFLSGIVAQAYRDGYLPEYELVGVLGNRFEKTQAFAELYQCEACVTIEQLMALKPDYTAEAASISAIVNYASYILEMGSSLIVLSIGAFSDAAFYQNLCKQAKENDRKIYIASGAVGGFDILRTASLMGGVEVQMSGKKSPQALTNTPLYQEGLLEIEKPLEVFSGTSAQAIEILPTKVNVAIAIALASAGVGKTKLSIEAIPDYVGDEHRIRLQSAEIETDLKIYSKTSAVAGWSIVAVLQNIVSPVVF